MTPSQLVRHARVLWRTERIIAELRLKRLLTNLGLQAVAALIAACGVLLFELAAYFALVQKWDAIWSAIALGFVNLALAGLIAMLALRRPRARELALASEIHQQALAALEADIQKSEADAPASLRAAIESAAIPMLAPLIPLVIQRLQKRRSEKSAGDAA